MMLNIKTGYNNVIQRPNPDIAILVSSLHKLKELGVPFLFTNGHAYMQESEYFDNLADLDRIAWNLLRNRDFQRDPEDPGKVGRYQAEGLVFKHVPVTALLGIVCYDSVTETNLQAEVQRRMLNTPVKAIPDWYF
jgi:ssDNA thymidine ADP-ribosyltransferase, DarT